MNQVVQDRRRNFLSSFACASSIVAMPSSLYAAVDDPLHRSVARNVKALNGSFDRKLRVLIPNGCADNIRPIIAAFQEATGVQVDFFEASVNDINAELTLDTLSGGASYDLALPATFGIPDLVAAGAIIPLTEFAAKYEPKAFRNDILYQTGDSFDDEIYGFQTDGDAYMMFYHRDLLENPKEQADYSDKFNQALAVPTTWEELDRQIAFFNRPDKGLTGGLLFRTPSYLAWEWWVRFHAKGLWPFDTDLNPQIDSLAGIDALQEMIDVTRHLSPDVGQLDLFGNWKRFGQGNVYCNIGWGGSQKYLNGSESKMKDRMVFGPTPGGIVNGELISTPYFNWGWNYVVTASSPVPELAYLFSLFASTPKMSTEAVRQAGGFFDPFRPEHYRDAVVLETYSEEFLKVHEASMRSAIPDLYLANRNEYFQSLSVWLDRALRGKVSAKDALTRTAQKWRLINKRADQNKQALRWRQLRKKYPAALQTRLKDLG